MQYDLHFLISLASISIIVLYIVLVFKNVNPLIAICAGIVLGFIFNHTTPIEMGKLFADALGSFMALIGFIIMLGRGLGRILIETKVSHNIVHKIIYTIGINTKRRFKIGVIASSITIVAILGTLAGGLAIIAPILRPIAAKIGLPKPTLAVLLQASGEEGLILGPFAPPVLTLIGVSHLSYLNILLLISIPISLVTLTVSWIMATKFETQYSNQKYELEDQDEFKPNRQQNLATLVFIISFISCLIYGVYNPVKTSYVIFVMLFLSFITGISSGLSLSKIFDLLIDGMKDSLHLFLMFFFLDPFLNLVQSAGGFNAILEILKPIAYFGGKPMVAIITGLTGAFGMPAASEAVIKLLYSMFLPLANRTNLDIVTFAFSILIATRIVNFAYPGPNMFAAQGLSSSENSKAMIRNGLMVTLFQVLFLVAYCLCFA